MSAPDVELIVPRELARATGRLAGSQVFVSASLPLNATVGAVAAKNLSGHEGLAGTSVGVAFLFSMLSLFIVGSIAQNLGRKPVLLAGLSLLATGATVCGLAIWAGSFPLLMRRHGDLRQRPGAVDARARGRRRPLPADAARARRRHRRDGRGDRRRRRAR